MLYVNTLTSYVCSARLAPQCGVMFVSALPPTEFVGTSITSTGYGEYYSGQGFSRAQIDEVEQSLIRQNRWMYDVNFGCKGASP
jgi:hypothetical protein